MPKINRSDKLPHPRMSVRDLANLALLDTASGPELVVLLRLVRATAVQRSKVVIVSNAELYRTPRSAAAALRTLEDSGLVRVRYDGAISRTIEVLP